MEPIIRGILEKNLDIFLRPENLRDRVDNYKPFLETGFINSLEEALFGALFECMALSLVIVKRPSGSETTIDEMTELYNIIMNRSLEIKSKISEAVNY